MKYQSVTIYLTTFCPYCLMATKFFKKRKIPFKKIHVDDYPGGRRALEKKTNHRTVPMIYIGDKFIGGYDELVALDRGNKLQGLLEGK